MTKYGIKRMKWYLMYNGNEEEYDEPDDYQTD
jgi:hypothetical protein